MAFTSMNRYIDKQAELTSNTVKKTVFTTLKNSFNRIIMSLRQDIAHNVVVVPNQKKNNTSSEVVPLKT